MYTPRQFREDRQDVLIAALRAIQFAALVVPGDAGIEAVHLPLLLRERDGGLVLEGHLAIGNPLWKSVAGAGSRAALAIFQGPHAYVHPGWYETKRATGKAVPTWNYVAVHVRGTLTIERDPAWLHDHVDHLSRVNEADRAEPWALSDAPAGYIDGMLGAIVGLVIRIEAIKGVWKMIQHHPQANRLGVIAGLSAEDGADAQAVAAVMAEVESARVGSAPIPPRT